MLGGTAVGVEAAAELTSKHAVDDKVDGRVGGDQQITDVVVVEIHLIERYTQTTQLDFRVAAQCSG